MGAEGEGREQEDVGEVEGEEGERCHGAVGLHPEGVVLRLVGCRWVGGALTFLEAIYNHSTYSLEIITDLISTLRKCYYIQRAL